MDKIEEIRVEEVQDFEENKHFWRIYYVINEKIVILGNSELNLSLLERKQFINDPTSICTK